LAPVVKTFLFLYDYLKNIIAMKKYSVLLAFIVSLQVIAQKELWGVCPGDQFNNPSSDFGKIVKYDINGENGVVIHEFDSIHGYTPTGRLFLASNGKLYGTTLKGGVLGPVGSGASSGVLFEYDLIFNQFNVVHYFDFDNNRFAPDIGVIEPILGILCGATNNQIYKYNLATGNISFSNQLPYLNFIHGELMKATDGNIYGTSFYGPCPAINPVGPYYGNYIKYNLTTNNVNLVNPINCDETTRGSIPTTQLIEVTPGKLVGSCSGGGINIFTNPFLKGGTLLELDINTNVFTKKIDFDYFNNGAIPKNIVQGDNGKVYGFCEEGGSPQTCDPDHSFGTLYEYTPATNALEVKQYFNYCVSATLLRYPQYLMKTSNGYFIGITVDGFLFKYDVVTNEITFLTAFYKPANLIEICRKPSYHFFDVDTFDTCIGATFTYDVQNTNATSYQWQQNGTTIDGQTTGVLNLTNITTSNAGDYTCIMTNECGTTTTMVLHLTVNCLGTNSVATLEKSIKLYPNPTNTILNIDLPTNIDVAITSLKVIDLLGQEVLSSNINKTKIDVSNLSNGIYIVSLYTNYGVWNGKFVKE
jgi:hypothetical protein